MKAKVEMAFQSVVDVLFPLRTESNWKPGKDVVRCDQCYVELLVGMTHRFFASEHEHPFQNDTPIQSIMWFVFISLFLWSLWFLFRHADEAIWPFSCRTVSTVEHQCWWWIRIPTKRSCRISFFFSMERSRLVMWSVALFWGKSQTWLPNWI